MCFLKNLPLLSSIYTIYLCPADKPHKVIWELCVSRKYLREFFFISLNNLIELLLKEVNMRLGE